MWKMVEKKKLLQGEGSNVMVGVMGFQTVRG